MHKILFTLLLILSAGCSRFPYTGVIDESARFVVESYPNAFKEIVYKNEKISYLSLGDDNKDIILFIHGSPGSWKSFAHFFKNEKLLESFKLITFDRFGYNLNRKGIPHGSLDDQIIPALEILKIENKLNKNVYVVGHSYGGPVAVKLAIEKPQSISGVVLVAASVDPLLEEELWYQSIAKLWGIRSIIPDTLDVVNREIIMLKDELLLMDKQYSKIDKPFYIIQGGIDKLVPVENINYLKDKTSHIKTRFKVIKNMKHFVPWAFPSLIEDGIFWLYKNQR